MHLREGIINLAITCALVLLVTLTAIFFRNRDPVAQVTRTTGSDAAVPAATPVAIAKGPKERRVEDRFLSFPKPEIIPSPDNEADTLRLKVAGEEYIFVLYFVDALDASAAHPERVSAQAAYFGKAAPSDVTETGKEARDYVLKLLSTHAFQLLTRWERVPNTDRYYALILLENEPKKWLYLADLLVRQGYARIDGVTTPLPDDKRSVEAYLYELRSSASYARQRRLGIWAKVRS
jgi:hypothetical protein